MGFQYSFIYLIFFFRTPSSAPPFSFNMLTRARARVRVYLRIIECKILINCAKKYLRTRRFAAFPRSTAKKQRHTASERAFIVGILQRAGEQKREAWHRDALGANKEVDVRASKQHECIRVLSNWTSSFFHRACFRGNFSIRVQGKYLCKIILEFVMGRYFHAHIRLLYDSCTTKQGKTWKTQIKKVYDGLSLLPFLYWK